MASPTSFSLPYISAVSMCRYPTSKAVVDRGGGVGRLDLEHPEAQLRDLHAVVQLRRSGPQW